MGIYLFNTDVLIDLLNITRPMMILAATSSRKRIHSHEVFGFDFDDYWEDIGTIRSFYETNLKLTASDPPFNFYDPAAQFTRTRASCPARW